MEVPASRQERDLVETLMPGGYATGNAWWSRSLGIMDTVLTWVGANPHEVAPIAAPNRILVANTGHMGDAILATAVLPALRSAFPKCHIGVVIGSWSRPVFDKHPLVDEIHLLDHWRLNRGSDSWWGRFQHHETTRRQALDEIIRRGYDVAIDLRPYFGNAIPLFWQADIPIRIGYTSGGFGPLLTHPVPWRRRAFHVIDYHRVLLKLLPLGEEHLARLQPTLAYSDEVSVLSPLAATVTESKDPYLIVHMGSGAAFKEWPMEAWHALCRRLASEGRTVVLTGAGRAEAERCEQVGAGLPVAVNLCDQLVWPDLLRVIRRARVLVAVDSMAGHLAAALGTPCVIISNGINHPDHWRPHASACRVLMHPVPCAPCFKPQGCAGMDCVRNVSVDQVWNAMQELLA